MKSSFGSKRKPRKIEVDEDDDGGARDASSSQSTSTYSPSAPSVLGRKAFKKSSLRKSIVLDDGQLEDDSNLEQGAQLSNTEESGGNEKTAISRPALGRSGSTGRKKTSASSRLSFGLGEIISGDAAEALEDHELFTPKKSTLGRRIIETNAMRKSLPAYQIPLRGGDDEEERPTYSKDYLNELKSSTPSTPKDLRALSITVDDDGEGLDESELAGAMVVDTEGMLESPSTIAAIPTEAEIREKKDRRARLGHEQDFISLDDDGRGDGQLSLFPRKKKAESRLVREDEDLGEGFDEFVDDGRISLGKKAEREAKRRQRAAMADLIHDAEGSASDSSDDSEAERRAAFESAQTRAGMDGLSKPEPGTALHQIPPKITPIPNITDCLQKFMTTMTGMQQELARRTSKMEELQREKGDILAREQEVQRLLKEAGDRYSKIRADTGLPVMDPKALVEGQNGFIDPMMANRGLESFGNTPIGRPQVDDIG